MVDNSAETLVFINYRSKDAASAAALLYAEMSSRFGPDAVFLDYESIRLGHDYEVELLTRVRCSAVLLVIIGDRWLDGEPGERPIDDPADWVHREILQAMDHGVPVLPVLFSGATLDAARLPPALTALASYQYFQVRRRQRSDIMALGDHLLRHLPRLAEHQARRTTVPADGRRPVALTGLPPATRTFVGRAVELRRLSAVLHGDEPGECAVIAGLAGVGKTALALVAAHRALRAGWFAGGALMIDMRGYDAPDRRVRPEAALGGVLPDLGIRAEHVPPDSAARVRLWRTILSERAARGLRTLIIVDNAFSSEQVRPLLPAVAGHRVLVTSRHTLSDLDAVVTRLDVLDPADAGQLVREHLTAADPDDDRARQHDAHVEQVARLCGGLPLAIRIAGALLAADRGQSVAEMVETLTDECCRLEELSYDGSLAVRSAFDLSYRHLADPDARLFRLLGVHPGPEFSVALADVVVGGTSRGNLGRLHRANLVEASRERGRWRMHDLVRLHAQQLARSDPEGGVVVGRIVEYYIALCGQARPGTDPVVLDALRELDRELSTVVALVNQAHETELDDRVIRLAEEMATYFDLRKCWDAWILVDRVALRSAHRIHDERAAGRIRLNLGVAYRDRGRFDDALGCFDRALVQFRREADRRRLGYPAARSNSVSRRSRFSIHHRASVDRAMIAAAAIGSCVPHRRSVKVVGRDCAHFRCSGLPVNVGSPVHTGNPVHLL